MLTFPQDKFQLLEDWLLTPTADDSTVARFPLLYMKRYSENNRGVHCRVEIPVRHPSVCHIPFMCVALHAVSHCVLVWCGAVCFCFVATLVSGRHCHHDHSSEVLDHRRDGP